MSDRLKIDAQSLQARPRQTAGGQRSMLLDFVVSRALAIDSHCLAQCAPLLPGDPTQPVPYEPGAQDKFPTPALSDLPTAAAHHNSDFEQHLDQLLSAWQMTSRLLSKTERRQAAARIRELRRLIPKESSFARVAKELLHQEQSRKRRAALRQVMDAWVTLDLDWHSNSRRRPKTVHKPVASQLLQADSQAWREAFIGRTTTDSRLRQSGLGRTYRRARKMSRKYIDNKLSTRKLKRWRCRVSLVVGQLELLDPYLNDQNREALWYLTRLQRNLARRIELKVFEKTLRPGLDSTSESMAVAYRRSLEAARKRTKVLARRSEKLVVRGFGLSPAEYLRTLGALATDDVKVAWVEASRLPQAPTRRAPR